jgi:hypothetical protein
VFLDPAAKAEAEALGLAVVPVAVQGDRSILILHTDQLREFLGLPVSDARASYRELADAMNRVLVAVEEAVRLVPSEMLSAPTPNRGRDLRELVFNIHDRIGPMVDALASGVYPWVSTDEYALSRRFGTTAELVSYCREMRTGWFEGTVAADVDRVENDTVETKKGPVTQLQLLESRAFHSAQHLRQIYVFLRQIGITPGREMSADEMKPIVLGDQVF